MTLSPPFINIIHLIITLDVSPIAYLSNPSVLCAEGPTAFALSAQYDIGQARGSLLQ